MQDALKLLTIPFFSSLGVFLLYTLEAKFNYGPVSILAISTGVSGVAAICIFISCVCIDGRVQN